MLHFVKLTNVPQMHYFFIVEYIY